MIRRFIRVFLYEFFLGNVERTAATIVLATSIVMVVGFLLAHYVIVAVLGITIMDVVALIILSLAAIVMFSILYGALRQTGGAMKDAWITARETEYEE